jgi:hypothetical protein
MDKTGLFIHLPKTAGTFIDLYFREAELRDVVRKPNNHSTLSEIENCEDYYSFGFIRHPLDFYVSRYFYFKQKSHNQPEGGVSINNDEGLIPSAFALKYQTLEDHINYGLKSNLDRFWLSEMFEHFYHKNGKEIVNYIGKFEDLENELEIIVDKLGVEPKISVKEFFEKKGRVNTSKHDYFMKYYTPELKEKIYEKDKVLFDKYGYKI